MDMNQGYEFPVVLRDLTTGYRHRGKTTAITRGLTSSLRRGELTCLLGRNGSGKSTLLRTLSGFLKPLGGTIEILGQDLGSYTPAELARLIGVVLTEKMSLEDMTVRRLVEMGRSPYTGFWGRLTAADSRVVGRSLELVGMADFASRQMDTLSDGERQKTLIAKALAQQTPIIYLDEPTAFLDYPSKVETMRLLGNLAREEGKAVFLSTHDLELALQIADRVWLMDRNAQVVTGTPEELSEAGLLQQYFGMEGMEFDVEYRQFRIL